MAMEITNNYSGYTAQGMAESNVAGSTKKKEEEKASKSAGSGKAETTTDYMSKLEKLAPSVEFRIGNTFSSAKSGKTLTINPKLLEKMQNDPEKEKEMKELIQGVEAMTMLSESLNKTSGWKTVYRHSYIDENGKYCHIALVRNEHGYKMSEKLREERRENSEKLLKKTKEKAAQKKKELQEELEEKRAKKRAEKADEKTDRVEDKTAYSKAEQLLREKITDSKDGMIYVYDTDMKTMMEAMKEEHGEKIAAKEQAEAGANLDLQV